MRAAIIAAVGSLLFTSPAYSDDLSSVLLHDTPRELPAISFADSADLPLTLEAWRGRNVLLNIWATWCGPCRAEMPTLDRLQARLGSDRFEVVALSIDRAGIDVVREFYDEIGIEHLTMYVDETERTGRSLEILALPTTILVDPNGRELGRLVGAAQWDAPAMVAFIESVIEE